VIAGEWYRQREDYLNAENEFREITTLQPDNPWGWYLLGDLYTEQGRIKKGKEFYTRVLRIVPEHYESKTALSAY
jgi:tetratricopeptide (TPR) repeat protein